MVKRPSGTTGSGLPAGKFCGVLAGAAGVKLDASLVDRIHVNMGTTTVFHLQDHNPVVWDGQVHCQPMGSWWGGAVVVVRGRESRLHGEGRQRVEQGS